tara:strand:+ start:14 stop:265 length:252 start_codon:yes stop_codon:yes gene_type:complete
LRVFSLIGFKNRGKITMKNIEIITQIKELHDHLSNARAILEDTDIQEAIDNETMINDCFEGLVWVETLEGELFDMIVADRERF